MDDQYDSNCTSMTSLLYRTNQTGSMYTIHVKQFWLIQAVVIQPVIQVWPNCDTAQNIKKNRLIQGFTWFEQTSSFLSSAQLHWPVGFFVSTSFFELSQFEQLNITQLFHKNICQWNSKVFRQIFFSRLFFLSYTCFYMKWFIFFVGLGQLTNKQYWHSTPYTYLDSKS